MTRKSTPASALLALCLSVGAGTVAHAADDHRGLSRKLTTPFLHGTYRALIIGNNEYRDPTGTWRPLDTAVSDAKIIASVLREDYGFSDVEIVLNGTQREILLALDALADRTHENDSVVVFYAGHGFKEDEKDRAFWIPVDAQGQDHTTFIRNSTIRDELNIIAERAKHTLLISDSCFSGSLLRGGNRGAVVKGDGDRYYEKVAQKKSVQILAAGGVEFVDDNYRNSGHSPFTYFLLSELKYNDASYLTATELATNVEKAVANNVSQTPESGVLQGTGDELGEFIFSKISVKIEITAEPAAGTAQPHPVPITVETPTIVINTAPRQGRTQPPSAWNDKILSLPTL